VYADIQMHITENIKTKLILSVVYYGGEHNLNYIFDWLCTCSMWKPHHIIPWLSEVTSATVVVLYSVNVSDIFILHNTTNKCTYVKCVLTYYSLPISFSPFGRHHLGTIQDYEVSKQTIKGISEPFIVSKHVSKFLHNHWMPAYCKLTSDKIQFLL
jgi:hypothetical protein